MITKEELHRLIFDSKQERSFEEEYVEDVVQVGTEYCNSCTWGGHEHPVYHPLDEVIKGTRTRTEVEYDYQKLRLSINESTRNLEQLVVLQEVALENQGTKEFNEYKIAYHEHLRNVNKKFPQLIGNLVSTVLKNTQIPIKKKQEFIMNTLETLDIELLGNSILYESPHTKEKRRHHDLCEFPSETHKPVREFLKEYTPNLEFNSSSYFYRLWMSENPERISDVVTMIGSYAKQDPTILNKLLNPENKSYCFDERDFLPGAYYYAKDIVHSLKFDVKKIVNSKDQYNTRLWCKLNSENALDMVVSSLLTSGKLNDKKSLSSWEGLPEIYEPLKNGLAGRKDARFAKTLLKSLDANLMNTIEFAKTIPAIGISPIPEYAVPLSGYERAIDCAKGLVNLLVVGGLAFGSAFAGKYGVQTMDPVYAQVKVNESPALYGLGSLATMALCAFVSLPVGIGIALYLNGRLDGIKVSETPAQKAYKEGQLKKLDAWRMDSMSKIRQHYQQQVAI